MSSSQLGSPLEGGGNKDFRGIVGSVGAPRPQWAYRGNVPSPEQAPWHDVVV